MRTTSCGYQTKARETEEMIRRLIVVVVMLLVAVGCTAPPNAQDKPMIATKDLVFLTRDDCVNTDTMRARLDDALKGLGLASDYQFIDLATLQASDPRTGYPTPTLLYRDHDLFGMTPPTPPFPAPT